MQGQVLQTLDYNGMQQKYSISTLPTGQYLIEIVQPNITEVHKLIKK